MSDQPSRSVRRAGIRVQETNLAAMARIVSDAIGLPIRPLGSEGPRSGRELQEHESANFGWYYGFRDKAARFGLRVIEYPDEDLRGDQSLEIERIDITMWGDPADARWSWLPVLINAVEQAGRSATVDPGD